MTDYSPQAITVDGVTPTPHNAAAGDKLTSPGAGRFLRVINGSASSITLTVSPPGETAYSEPNPAKVITVAAGATKLIPVLAGYGNPADAFKVALTWSATTTVTFEYTRIGVA